uniref:Uncharacterized protein n=1 Tax=Monopsis debilis var. debilis TaxID=2041136 RepID=A0A291F166_9ASTR|nr:hypothetical protein Mo_de_de1Pt0522 [Monopsis debilis var. debilis]
MVIYEGSSPFHANRAGQGNRFPFPTILRRIVVRGVFHATRPTILTRIVVRGVFHVNRLPLFWRESLSTTTFAPRIANKEAASSVLPCFQRLSQRLGRLGL